MKLFDTVIGLSVKGVVPVFFAVSVWARLTVFTTWAPKSANEGAIAAPEVIPWPCRFTTGEPAESAMVTVPLKAPVFVGVNVTLILQLEPAATCPLQFVVSLKFAVAATECTFNGAAPLFVSVTVCASDGVLTIWLPKINCALFRVAPGANPVPVSEIVCEPRLSFTVSMPDSVPATIGVYTTLSVHAVPGASEAEQLLLWVKSPRMVIAISVNVALPVFVSVAVNGWLIEPTRVGGKACTPGVSTALGCVPVPERLTG